MYRLLIVDDEPIIVEGLYHLFQNLKHLDLDIYKAYSGEEALSLMDRARIDIVLSDISMPGIDGIRLMEEIRSHWPSCRVIFLTAYNDFNYIYAALKNDCVSYLLKTEKDEAVIGAVEKAVKSLDDSMKDKLLSDEVKNRNFITDLLLKKECLMTVLNDNEFTPDTLRGQFEELKIPLNSNYPFIMVVGKLDEKPKNLNAADMQKCIYNLCSIAEYNLAHRLASAYMEFERLKIVWFLQPIQMSCAYDYIEDESKHLENEELWKQESMFAMYSFEALQEQCKQSLGVTMSFVISNGSVEWSHAPSKFEKLKALLNSEPGSKSGVIMIESNVQSTVRIITFLKQYIADHLKEDISLITLSELVHFNPSYLSRLFKQVTGESLSDYILAERINKAKKLLAGSRLKIYEVADEVGFESVTYFTRVFKNTTNITPQKYKDTFTKQMM